MDSEDRSVKDEEVGKLWSEWHGGDNAIRSLIIKLMGERALAYMLNYTSDDPAGEKRALRDFGIDPATWPKE